MSSSSSRPPRSRSSMFVAPSKTTTISSSKATLLSKIGALRRVSSFSSLASSRTSSPPFTPSTPSSPRLQDDDGCEFLPQDIPRSSSVMSWFSSDEESNSDSRKPWRMPKLKRKTRMSPKNPSFTFTTSASSLSSTPSTALGAPLHLISDEPVLLPAVHPIELDLALDFDCAFPRPSDSDPFLPPSPPFTPALHSLPFGSPVHLRHPRESALWYDREEEEDEDRNTLYAPSSPEPSSPWSSIRRSSHSPDMTEEDYDDPTFDKFCQEEEEEDAARSRGEIDEEVCRRLAAFRFESNPSNLVPSLLPQSCRRLVPPRLRSTNSVESLLDPHFDSPGSPSPTALSSPTFTTCVSDSSSALSILVQEPKRTTGFSFPLPPNWSRGGTTTTNPQQSFLGLDFEDDDQEEAPWYDCDP